MSKKETYLKVIEFGMTFEMIERSITLKFEDKNHNYSKLKKQHDE